MRVVLNGLKVERTRQCLDPVVERLPPRLGEFCPIWTPVGVVPLCPVEAFRFLRQHALRDWAPRVTQCKDNEALTRHLSHLCR